MTNTTSNSAQTFYVSTFTGGPTYILDYRRPRVAVVRLQTPTRSTGWSEVLDFIACQDVDWIVLDDTRIDQNVTLSRDEAYMLVCFFAAGMPMTTLDDLFVGDA